MEFSLVKTDKSIEYLGEIKSDQRDKAAAADDECRYY